MVDTLSNLRCLLVSVQGGQIILPNSLVAEVLPFRTPLELEGAPRWVAGAILWQNLTTPLVSLGRLIFRIPAEADHNPRIIIVKALNADSKLPHMGLLGTSAPRPVNLSRADIVSDNSLSAADRQRPGVLSWALYEGVSVVIPDMSGIEAVLQPLLRS